MRWRWLLGALLVAAGCNGVRLEDGGRSPANIDGSYAWVSSSGGISPQEYTPETVGFNARMEIANGRARGYRDDVLVAESRVRVESSMNGVEIEYLDPFALLAFTQFERQRVEGTMPKGTVHLIDPCCDQYQHVFHKYAR